MCTKCIMVLLTEINVFVTVFVYVSCASLLTSYRFDLSVA